MPFTDSWLRRLLALSLELPEDAFVNIHRCNGLGEAFGM